jgi:hypothetical protein
MPNNNSRGQQLGSAVTSYSTQRSSGSWQRLGSSTTTLRNVSNKQSDEIRKAAEGLSTLKKA